MQTNVKDIRADRQKLAFCTTENANTLKQINLKVDLLARRSANHLKMLLYDQELCVSTMYPRLEIKVPPHCVLLSVTSLELTQVACGRPTRFNVTEQMS